MTARQDSEFWSVATPGRFVFKEHLGSGGMASVDHYVDTLLGRDLAVKRPKLHGLSGKGVEATIGQFKREAEALAKLDHPGVVRIWDLLLMPESDDTLTPRIVSEFVSGSSLEDVVADGARMNTGQALDLTSRLLDALGHCHQQGVFHRDIKPSNVMITPAGETKLIDFGIAKLKGTGPSGLIAGTPEYMSPEQCRGDLVDGRSDLYSLGCLLFRLLTGRAPFEAPEPLAVIRMHADKRPPKPSDVVDVHPDVDALVLTALCKEQDPRKHPHRFQTCAEMQGAVQKALGPSRFRVRSQPLPQDASRAGTDPWVDGDLSQSALASFDMAGTTKAPAVLPTRPPPDNGPSTPIAREKGRASEPGVPRREKGRASLPSPEENSIAGRSTSSSRERRLWLPAGVAAVGLTAVLALQLPQWISANPSPAQPQKTPQAGSTPPVAMPPVTTPDAVVVAFLDSLARGDADSTLAQLAEPASNPEFLTPEVLATVRQAYPITEIDIPEGGPDADGGTVPASYLLGDVPVDAAFTVVETKDGWQLADALPRVELGKATTLNSAGDAIPLPHLLEGLTLRVGDRIATPAESIDVFPGGYELTAGPDALLTTAGSVLPAGPGSLVPTEVELLLSDKGRQSVLAAAEAHLKACMSSKAAVPKVNVANDCGIGVDWQMAGTGGVRIGWKHKSGSLSDAKLKLKIVAADEVKVIAPINLKVEGTACATTGAKNCKSATARLQTLIATLGSKNTTVRLSPEGIEHYDNPTVTYQD